MKKSSNSLNRFLVFTLGKKHYAADIKIVREILKNQEPTPIPRSPVYITGIIHLKGEIVKVIDITKIIKLENAGEEKQTKIIVFVPEISDGTRFGLIVNDVHGVVQLPDEKIRFVGEKSEVFDNNFMIGTFKTSVSEVKLKNSRKLIEGDDSVVCIDIEDMLNEIMNEQKDIAFHLIALFNPDELFSAGYSASG